MDGTGRARVGALVALALTLTMTRTAGAVTGGSPDAGAHPYVAMLIGPAATGPSCTGVLLRADNGAMEVLTTAHCVFSAGGSRTGNGWQVQFGDTFSPSGPFYGGTYVVSDGYDPTVSQQHDLAAIVLDAPPALAPATLAAPGQEDASPDTSLTVVGTGQPHPGQRRVATEAVTRHDGSWLYLKPGSGNTCDGDSGAPDLIPGTDTVVALTDQGTCSADQDLRVDSREARQFLTHASQVAGAPLVTGQPADETVASGTSAQFTSDASGTPSPTVHWQQSTDGGASFSDIAGATASTLTIAATAGMSGNQYRAVFANSLASDTSSSATLTVTSNPGSGTSGLYHPLVPHRILDTRQGAGPVQPGSDRDVPVLGLGGVPTAGVSSVVLAAVVPLPQQAGDLEVYPSGSPPAGRTSNLNWPVGRTVANLVTVPIGSNGQVALSVEGGRADVALDVVGWYGDSSNQSGLRYTSLPPARVLDTGQSGMDVSAGADRRVPLRGMGGVPNRPDVVAVVLNLTVLGSQGPADVQVFPTAAAPAERTSNTNLVRGQTAAVAVNATLGSDGSVSLSVSHGSVRAIIDVAGYFSGTGDRFVPMTPVRVVDRATVTSSADTPLTLAGRDGIPADATAVVVNATGLDASAPADLSVFPSGQRPSQRTSVLNLLPGEAVPNLLVARLQSGALVASASAGSLHLIIDALGYMTAG
ncbi:MAG: trypsin-like serine protease [Actinomycetota bacterium]|nr:trypsin-like serine protease [Actinomycetota bacterium]